MIKLVFTREHRRKISEAANRRVGIVYSEERNRKISSSLMGHIHSEETRRKIGIANKGKVRSLEAREKSAAWHRGKPRSVETLKKMAATHLLRVPYGSRFTGVDGYVKIKIQGRGWMLEHRWLMEQHLGRRLTSNEHVHHKDLSTDNNELSNLQLMTKSEHRRLHQALRYQQ